MPARLEHVNVTVENPEKTAEMLIELFGWHIRWSGDAKNGGRTVHVGTEEDYVALYTGPGGNPHGSPDSSYTIKGGLNHLGVVVDDLDATEAQVKSLGYATHSHADYEPGKRFYFHEENGVEIEVISYA